MTLEKREAGVSAGRMTYFDGGEGRPVLFLHGFPTSAHLWRNLAPLVAPRARAIAPDLIGYGDSEKPQDAPLDIRAQARYVRELLHELGVDEFAVVGHDIGGGAAQLLALEGGVRTLVLIDSVTFDSWPIEGVRMLQGARPDQVDEEFVERVVHLAFDLGMGHRERLTDEDLEEYVRPWRQDPAALLRAARAVDGQGLAGTEAALASLGVPAFVLWGEDDPYQPSHWAEKLGDVMPGSTVALLPGCSHFALEDAPETAGPLVFEFLRTVYLGESRHGRVGGVPADSGISLERPGPAPADE